MITLPPPTYEQTIEAIVHCDIPRANVRIKYEDYLQSDEVTITDLGAVSDAKLRCLKGAVHPFYILTIENTQQRAAFYEFSEREDRPKWQAEAREWLRSRGLLDRVPTFNPGGSVEAFAEALEVACGQGPGTALMLRGPSTLTVRPEFLTRKSFKTSADSLYCLTQMFAASDAKEKGVDLVFIGNAAYVEEDEK